jgi:predicted nucleic acid-binding protein
MDLVPLQVMKNLGNMIRRYKPRAKLVAELGEGWHEGCSSLTIATDVSIHAERLRRRLYLEVPACR